MDKGIKYIITLKRVAVIGIAAFNLNAAAQQTFHSLEEVWKFALISNPDIKVRQLQIDQAIQDKRTSGSFLFPKISSGFNGQDNIDITPTPVPGELVGKPGQTEYLQFGKHFTYNTGINITQSLLDWQSIFQSKITKENVVLQRAEKSYFEQSLKEQLAQLYFASIIANKSVEIGEADLAIADTFVFLAEDKFNQGLIDALECNKTKINRNSVFEKLEQNKQYRGLCLLNLKKLIGVNPNNDILLTETPDIKNNDVYSNLLPNNKYIELYWVQTVASGYEVNKAMAKFTPKIDLTGYIGEVQYQDNFTMSFKKSDWKPNKYIGLSVSIPIFTGFSNSTQYKSATIRKNIAEINLLNEQRQSTINDSILQTNYFSSLKIAISSNVTYQIAGKNLQLSQQKYKEGLISLDEYQKVFEDYLSVENQYLNNIANYSTNKATIESRK